MHFRLLETIDFHLKAKNERFTAAGSWRYRQHLKYEKCASLFGRVRHKLRQKAYRTCSNIIFPHSTNEIIEVSFAYTRKRLETSKQLATISNIACEQALRGTGAGVEGEPLLLPQPQSLGEPARRLLITHLLRDHLLVLPGLLCTI